MSVNVIKQVQDLNNNVYRYISSSGLANNLRESSFGVDSLKSSTLAEDLVCSATNKYLSVTDGDLQVTDAGIRVVKPPSILDPKEEEADIRAGTLSMFLANFMKLTSMLEKFAKQAREARLSIVKLLRLPLTQLPANNPIKQNLEQYLIDRPDLA